MGKSKATALIAALIILGLAVMRTATASHGGDHFAFSGGTTFKGLVVKTAEADEGADTEITAEPPDWQTLDSRGFSIPAGESQLIVVDVNSLARCEQDGGFGQCLMRVLVGRTLAGAVELEPKGFSNILLLADQPTEQRRSMIKALCVQNSTASPANISVWLQAAKEVIDPDVTYVVFDHILKIGRHAPCSPAVNI